VKPVNGLCGEFNSRKDEKAKSKGTKLGRQVRAWEESLRRSRKFGREGRRGDAERELAPLKKAAGDATKRRGSAEGCMKSGGLHGGI